MSLLVALSLLASPPGRRDYLVSLYPAGGVVLLEQVTLGLRQAVLDKEEGRGSVRREGYVRGGGRHLVEGDAVNGSLDAGVTDTGGDRDS